MKGKSLVLSACLLAGVSLGAPSTGSAQLAGEPADESGIYTLGQIVVSADRCVVERAGTVREVTAEEISQRRARSLEQALGLLPGVDIRTATDGVARVDIRGMRSRHVLLLLNGVPFNSTYDGQFDPSIIPVENIARIKVSYGNHSVLYGQGGLGGVIDVITKKGTESVASTALAEYGQENRWLGRATLSGAKGPVSYFIGSSATASDGFPMSDDFDDTSEEDGGTRNNSDNERGNVFANLGYTPREDLDIGITAALLTGEFGKPPITINDKNDSFATTPKYDRIEDYQGESGQLSASYHPDGPLSLRGWVFVNRMDESENRYDDSRYDSMDDPTVKGTYDAENTSQIYGGTLQSAANLGRAGTLTLGLSGEDQSFDTHGNIRDVEVKATSAAAIGSGSASGPKKYAVRRFSQDESLGVYSLALEYEVTAFERLGLVAGYSHHWLDKAGGSDDDYGGLLGAHYDLFEGTRLRASAGRNIRFPSTRQLYGPSEGNPDLTTERSYNYEVGVEQDIGARSSVSLTGFHIDVEDYIEKNPTSEIFENNDQYRFQGLEWTAETRVIDNLALRTGYTFMHSKDRSANSEKQELQYRPEHKLTFAGLYSFDQGLSLHGSIVRVMNQYYYSRTSPLQKARLNDITVLNLKAEQMVFRDMLHVYVSVENLLDRDYEEAYGFPRSGRTVFAGVELRL